MGNSKIFIVEDDKFYAKLIHHKISMDSDFDVRIFNSGQELLDNLHEKPHVVSLDYTLPDYLGLELTTKILHKCSNCQVILLSAQSDLTIAVELMKAGAYDYLIKDNDAIEKLWFKIHKANERYLLQENLEDDRNRIAMELHDGIGQQLVALNLFMSQLNPKNDDEVYIKQKCNQIVTDSLRQMKTLCYNLAPPEIEYGLSHSLEVFFRNLSDFSLNIKYEFQLKMFNNEEIEVDITSNFFRIIQEFVSNSQKYSNCKNIKCKLFVKANKISAFIFDDGDGFDVNKVTHGFGLKNMLKRAKIIGAKINLESTIGEGTKMLLEI